MGYAKYHEDDYRIYCERLYSIGLQDGDKHRLLIVDHRCPYCSDLFGSKELLFSHIRHVHNITEPILFINGIIVKNDDTIYVADIKSAQIQMYGFDRTISINNEAIPSDANEDCIDITAKVNSYISRLNFCRIQIGNSSSRIEKYSLYSVNQGLLKDYIREWENNVKFSIPFRPFNVSNNLINHAELLYLQGIYNYFIACQAAGNDKVERYYEANSILKQFIPTDSLGLCIQKIVAFKFNWVNTLGNLCCKYGTDDDFNPIHSFFINEETESIPDQSGMSTVFIEDELQDIYNAILAFVGKDYDFVRDYLNNHDTSNITDINLRDKILLLKSRMLCIDGKNGEARYTFSEIRTDEFKS